MPAVSAAGFFLARAALSVPVREIRTGTDKEAGVNQQELFFETAEEALAAVVAAAGGFKSVGHRMRPDLAADQAGNWLRDCLNPHKRDKLSPGQLVLLLAEGKRAGAHGAMHYFEREAGYLPSQS